MTAPPPMRFWTLDRVADALVARATGALPRGASALSGISTDTRAIQPGNCFVALAGDRFDAHDFLDQAVDAGAAALVVSRAPRPGMLTIPVYVVDDTLLALGDLARYRRRAWGKRVVGVAGSNGKTSTKELLAGALGAVFAVHATRGNLNNRIGVPLTLLGTPDAADVAIIELGTSIPGEIAMLRAIAEPDIAVVTSIAEEHLEGFGSLEGVLREESAAVEGVACAVIPAHEHALETIARRTAQRVITAGLDAGDVHASSWQLADDGSGIAVVEGVTVRSPLRGVHNVRNMVLAIAVARELGVSVADAARGIARLTPPSMRSSWERIGGSLVINDAYNSNPGSARAALEMLAAAPGAVKVAVLGTMRELGDSAPRCHDEVAQAAVASDATVIAGLGEFADAFARVAPHDARVVTASDVDELWCALEPRLIPGATILLKASRGVRLERILPHLTSWATSSADSGIGSGPDSRTPSTC